MRIYQACVLSTLLYGSESWTTYMCQERRLNTNSDILDRARIRSMHSLLSQRRLRWLGHIRCMEDGRLPKDILSGQLTSGARPVGCPALRFKDACNRDMKACDISPKDWEAVAEDRTAWCQATHRGIERADEKRHQHAAEKRMRQKQNTALPPMSSCFVCSKDRHSRIGLHSHSGLCQNLKNLQRGASASSLRDYALPIINIIISFWRLVLTVTDP